LGSIRELVDASGGIAARYVYDAFGVVSKIGGDESSTLLFGSMHYYDNADLALAKFPAYDAALGLWLSEDKAGWDRMGNLYSYVHNRPTTRVDRLGLQDELPSHA
jgi:RHS repeat-associated protein